MFCRAHKFNFKLLRSKQALLPANQPAKREDGPSSDIAGDFLGHASLIGWRVKTLDKRAGKYRRRRYKVKPSFPITIPVEKLRLSGKPSIDIGGIF
jgi:hypothetical protein